MRVAVVLSHVPDPEGSAAGRCAVGLLAGLVALGVDVRAVAAHAPWEADAARAGGEVPVEVVRVDEGSPRTERVSRYVRPRTLLARDAGMRARVAALAADADVVLLDEIEAAALGPAVVGHGRWVAHLHCRAARDRPVRDPRRTAGRERLEHVRAERRVVRSAPALLANSAEVAAELRAAGARAVDVVPLALVPPAGPPADPVGAPVAGLIGSGGWAPTADAVATLLGEVWPRVRAAAPGAVLRLAGRGMTPAAFGAPGTVGAGPGPDGVEWVGEVDAADDFLRGLGLLLYPLGRGSGTKVKVLEALSLGVPVVTTPAGAEGAASGPALVVRDDPAAVAAAAADLLGDPSRRAGLAADACAAFLARHAPAAAAGRLVPVLERVAAGR